MNIPLILKQPLKFGDASQIQAIKNMEAALDNCKPCDGEGTVICRECNGSGKKAPSEG